MDYYESDPRLRRVLDELTSDRFCPDEPGLFRWIRDSLLYSDDYFLLADFGSYIDTQAEISGEFIRPRLWTRKAILNVARIGSFSSDRTVAEYAQRDLEPGPSLTARHPSPSTGLDLARPCAARVAARAH